MIEAWFLGQPLWVTVTHPRRRAGPVPGRVLRRQTLTVRQAAPQRRKEEVERDRARGIFHSGSFDPHTFRQP